MKQIRRFNASRFNAWGWLFLPLLAFSWLASAAPTFTKTFIPDTIGPGSTSTLRFDITNPDGMPSDMIAFTDNLPAGMTIATPGSASTDCSGFAILSAPDGGTSISLSDGQLAPGASCSVLVNVISSAMPAAGVPVTHMNVSGTLNSTTDSAGPATADLTVIAERPGFSKSFAPSVISAGQTSTLTLTIDNTANPSGVSTLSFSDNLPSGLVIAPLANASTDCGSATFPATLTAVPGTSSINLFANGFLPSFPALAAMSSCSVTVDVTTDTTGVFVNTTGELLAGGVSSGKATDALNVPLEFLAKSFTDDPTPPGGTVTLEFRITNLDRGSSATGIAFTDDLAATLAGLTFSSLEANDCGGSVGGVGTTDLLFTGGTLGPEAACTISISLSVPAAATPGAYINTTGAITATIGGSPVTGNMATDILHVVPAPLLSKQFMGDPVNPGDPVVLEFTVTNTSTTTSATDIAFEDVFSTVLPTASVTPGNDCCGAGSTCTFTPLFNPNPPCNPCDAIPGRLNISGGSLAPAGMAGDSCTFSLTLDVAADAKPGIYPNSTSPISATVDGATRIGIGASDDLTVIGAPTLSKAFTDDPVVPGGTVTLEFTLEHSPNALNAATDISFTDDLNAALTGLTANLPPSHDPPCGAGSSLTGSAGDTLLTLMGGALAAGESCTFSVTLDVPADAASDTYINTTSGISAMLDGTAASSAPASADLRVAGLSFSKEFVGDPVLPGGMVTLRFTLENTSLTDDATSISFTDSVSSALSGLTAAAPLPSTPCGPGSQITGTTSLIFVGGELMQGDPPCTFDILLNVPAGAADGSYVNTTSNLTASIDGSGVVLGPATDNLVVNSTLLSISKEFTDDPVAPGGTVNLRFTLSNLDASQAASDIAFTDVLGDVLPGLSATGLPFMACGGTVAANPDSGTIAFSDGALGPAAQCNFDVTVVVPGGAAANVYTNTSSTVTGMIGSFAVSGAAASDNLEVIDLLQFSKSFDGPSTVNGITTLTFTITNPGADTVSGISFSDDLNAVISGLNATNLPLSDVCGSGSHLSGTSFLAFTGGELPPMGGMCSFDVELQVPGTATAGTFPNTTSDLLQSGLKVADPATADLVVEPPPTFAKSFAPDTSPVDTPSTLTFTIDNTASTLAASSLDFTDNLPAGILVAATPNASTTCTGGTLTAVAGSGVISYTGGTVAAGASCTVQADVSAGTTGMFANTSGDLTSSSGNSGTASDTLTTDPAPGFSKGFAPNTISVGGISTLTFTIDNSGSGLPATALAFSDSLPAGMLVANPANASTDCTGGTLTAIPGASSLSYAGGSVAAMVTCTAQADVTAGSFGALANTSGDLTSSSGNSGTASDTLTVNPLPGVDGDGDGVDDAIEQAAPDVGSGIGDGNNDTLQDHTQSDVTSLPGLNGEYVTLVSTPSVLMNVSVGPPPAGQPGGIALPWGLFSYTVDDLLPGGIANVSMIVHTATNPTSFWKSGPEPGIPGDHYYEFLFDGTTGATLAGNVISLRFVDMQRGDDNVLTIDGLVMEPGGPALLGASVPSLNQWALLLLLGLMGAAGLYSLSRRAI